MSEQVKLKGKEFNLEGKLVAVGETAPDCSLVDGNLKTVQLSSFKGKALLVFSVPSLDTGVCSKETHHFNQEAAKFGDALEMVCVSMDLPFAQTRWCGSEGVKHVVTLSDYKDHEFGKKFGVRISELGLLARAVFLISADWKVQYVELVKETTEEPNYDKVLHAVSGLLAL